MRRLLFVAFLFPALVSSAGAGDSAKPATRIVFSAATVVDHGGYEWQIYSVLPSGGGVAQLTFGSEPATDPLPSPDGRLILFTRGKALWVMRSDGRGARRLVANASEPTWMPGSRRIAYVTRDGIRTIDLDGTRGRLLVSFAQSPAWSADGRSMAWAEWYSDHVDVRVRRDGKEWPIVGAAGFEGLALSPGSPKPTVHPRRWSNRRHYRGCSLLSQPRHSVAARACGSG